MIKKRELEVLVNEKKVAVGSETEKKVVVGLGTEKKAEDSEGSESEVIFRFQYYKKILLNDKII